MPLLRNIAGFNVGLINEGSGADTMRALDEAGGGGTYQGGGPEFPVNPNPVYYDPVPIRPVEPIEPIYLGPDGDHVNDLPAPNQVQVVPPADKPVRILPLIAIASAVLAMTGLHPFKRVGSGALLAGAVALLILQMNRDNEEPTGNTVVTQPNIL